MKNEAPNRKKPLRSVHQTPANPADFGRKTSPVRERLAREVRDMPPEERLRRGR